MFELYCAIRSENIELLKELMQKDEWRSKMWDGFEYLKYVVQTCNIELLQAVLETWPFDGPMNLKDYFEIDPVLRISERTYTRDQPTMLKMIQFLMPYAYNKDPERPDCYFLKDFFPGLVAHCSDEHFLVTEFLIHKFYSENNSLYPLIKKLEAAVEKSHYLCIFLHDDIDSVTQCFEYVKENFERFHYYDSVHFKRSVYTFTKLLAKDTPESIEIAVETFLVLLDKNYFELAEDWIHYTFRSRYKDDTIVLHDVPLLPMFHFLFNSINSKTQEKIYAIISEWFKYMPPNTRFVKIFNQSKGLLLPFISKPLDQKLDENTRQNLTPLNYDGKVPSLKEICRDVIRCKIFEQTNDVKEFMQRIWTLQLPLTVKCFLLYVPEASWMNNLQMF